MCVIAFVQKDEQRLTDDQINKMWASNSFGAGIAWKDTVQGVPVVRWKKGIELDDLKDEIDKLPLPHIIHFRNPSHGTSHVPTACHPFPLDPDVPMVLDGFSANGVLFHNGFFTGWKDKVIDWACRGGFSIPSGGWSDSRGLAWAAANLGNGILDLIDEKVIIMTPTDIESFGSGWTEMANGLYVSNLAWQNPPKATHYHNTAPASMSGGTKTESGTDKGKAGGTSQQGSFCGTEWVRANQHGRGTSGIIPGFNNPTFPLRPNASGTAQQDAVQEAGQGVVSSAVTARSAVAKANEELEWALSTARGTLCQDCRAVPGNVLNMDIRRCYKCWEAYQRKSATQQQGTCEFCSKLPTTWLTVKEAKWICHGCWREHGKPESVRDEDLRPADSAAMQAQRQGGSL